MMMQIIVAAGACAMGGCQRPCLWWLTKASECANAGQDLRQNVSGGRTFAFSFVLVAIGTQAVLSLRSSESPEGINRGE